MKESRLTHRQVRNGSRDAGRGRSLSSSDTGSRGSGSVVIEESKAHASSRSPRKESLHRELYVCPILYAFPGLVGSVEPCRYRPQRVIGSGAYSTVWSLTDRASENVTVAGKLTHLSRISEASEVLARSEATNVQACDHPNILRFFGTYEQNDHLLHIMEFADAGDLLSQVGVRAKAPGGPVYFHEDEALVLFAQLCLALAYLHGQHILHRDLKTSNVMVCSSGLIKVGDFGFSRKYTEDGASAELGAAICGTPSYLAPELWKRESYNDKADVWSLGVVMYEVLTLSKPFPAENLQKLINSVLQQDNYVPLPSERYSAELIELVNGLLRVDPACRPSVKSILATPLMRSRALQLLRINVHRLGGVDADVRARVAAYAAEAQGVL